MEQEYKEFKHSSTPWSRNTRNSSILVHHGVGIQGIQTFQYTMEQKYKKFKHSSTPWSRNKRNSSIRVHHGVRKTRNSRIEPIKNISYEFIYEEFKHMQNGIKNIQYTINIDAACFKKVSSILRQGRLCSVATPWALILPLLLTYAFLQLFTL